MLAMLYLCVLTAAEHEAEYPLDVHLGSCDHAHRNGAQKEGCPNMEHNDHLPHGTAVWRPQLQRSPVGARGHSGPASGSSGQLCTPGFTARPARENAKLLDWLALGCTPAASPMGQTSFCQNSLLHSHRKSFMRHACQHIPSAACAQLKALECTPWFSGKCYSAIH